MLQKLDSEIFVYQFNNLSLSMLFIQLSLNLIFSLGFDHSFTYLSIARKLKEKDA